MLGHSQDGPSESFNFSQYMIYRNKTFNKELCESSVYVFIVCPVQLVQQYKIDYGVKYVSELF